MYIRPIKEEMKMILDQKGKLFGKINIIDLLLILVVVLAVAFFGIKMMDDGGAAVSTGEGVRMEFYAEEVSDFVVENIKIGDTLTDDTGNINLGKIVDIEVGPSQSYSTNEKGEWVLSSREGFSSLRIVGEGSGRLYDHGVIVSGSKYGVGHSFTLRAGMGKIWIRVSGIEAI